MTTLREEVECWGLFAGAVPGHEVVNEFFTRENHREMFGVEYEGTDDNLQALRDVGHRMINERVE